MGYLPTALDLTLSGSDQTTLHEQAACATREFFGRRVFVRAVVEAEDLVPSPESLAAFCGQDAAETITGPEAVART
jgi:hypothetical protein